jgi:hypothetical protein
MLLAELTGMLSSLGSMLPMSEGMLSLPGMLLAEVAGILRKSFSVLLALPSMLPLGDMLLLGDMLPLGGMLPASVSTMLKNSASAAFTPAEYIKPFLDISPFCSQKAIRACSTAGSR